jgi:hypothetical protein
LIIHTFFENLFENEKHKNIRKFWHDRKNNIFFFKI